MDAILQKALSEQGLWAALFVVLLFYVLNQQKKRDEKSEQREVKYQDIIKELSENLSLKVDRLVEKVEEIVRK